MNEYKQTLMNDPKRTFTNIDERVKHVFMFVYLHNIN